MKNISFISIFFLSTISLIFVDQSFAMSGVTLKPSLTLQMQKNNTLYRQNIRLQKIEAAKALIETRKKANLEALAKIQAKKLQKTNSPSTIPFEKKPAQILPIVPPPITQKNNIVSTNFTQESIQNVDMTRVRNTWLSWYNNTRGELWLKPYTYDSRIDSTAHDWNIVFMSGKWQNHHRRNPSDSYYDFSVIDNWFINRWINPKVINRVKHVENVGYGYYRCSSSDCTDTLIDSIRSTYDFFMSEKWKTYDAHYKSIIQPNFTKIGVSILVNPSESRYYMTIHYITE